MISKRFIYPIIFLLLVTRSFAQTHTVTNESKATVIGTSSLHDWESEVGQISGTANLKMEAEKVSEITDVNVKFSVKSIESGKSKMNSITYETLKESAFPQIAYNITKVKSFDGHMATVVGDLSIAGFTKTTEVTGAVTTNGSKVTLSGRTKIDMTEFNIEPPTAMFGSIKVGKDVEIDFTIVLISK